MDVSLTSISALVPSTLPCLPVNPNGPLDSLLWGISSHGLQVLFGGGGMGGGGMSHPSSEHDCAGGISRLGALLSSSIPYRRWLPILAAALIANSKLSELSLAGFSAQLALFEWLVWSSSPCVSTFSWLRLRFSSQTTQDLLKTPGIPATFLSLTRRRWVIISPPKVRENKKEKKRYIAIKIPSDLFFYRLINTILSSQINKSG